MEWIVLLPPIIAIGLALWTREVFLSLVVGLWVGTTILGGGNPIIGLRGMAEAVVDVFTEPSNTRIILFSLLVGGLVALVQVSGGAVAFTKWIQERGWGKTRRSAELLSIVIGILVFVESSITSLIVGTLSRPFFDKLKIPREKLAYYCDATSAPVCMTIPLNGWGAFVLVLVIAQGYAQVEAVPLLAHSLLFNFFSLFSIAFAIVLAITGLSYGSMKKAEIRAATKGHLTRPGSTPMIADEVVNLKPQRPKHASMADLLFPVAVMIVMVFVSLFITGQGKIMEGSGSTAVLWAVGTAIGVAMLQYVFPRGGRSLLSLKQSTDYVLKGAAGLIGVVGLLVLAFALGSVSRDLEMGPYVVSLIGDSKVWWMPGWTQRWGLPGPPSPS